MGSHFCKMRVSNLVSAINPAKVHGVMQAKEIT